MCIMELKLQGGSSVNEENIRKLLPPGLSLGRTMHCLADTGSTNDELKKLALRGEAHPLHSEV